MQKADGVHSLFLRRYPLKHVLPALILALLLSACATDFPISPPRQAQLEQILEPDQPQLVAAVKALPDIDMLNTTERMRHFLNEKIDRSENQQNRIQSLFNAIGREDGLNIYYDSGATLTAEQVFNQRRANCIGFSAMFVALAREAGVEVYFQEVDVPPEWGSMNSDTLVQYRHVNTIVVLPNRKSVVVDFRSDLYRDTYPRRRLTDEEALAHFYSNIGMEELVQGNLHRAYAYMQHALKTAPDEAFLWSNMGIIQRRLGNGQLAEASYRKALDLDPGYVSAISNLAILYQQRDDNEMANQLFRYSEYSRLKNPYYRYALAQNAYQNGNYQEALEQLDVAVRAYSKEHRFFYLRALSLWELGDVQSALKSVRRALRTANDKESIDRYQTAITQWSDTDNI